MLNYGRICVYDKELHNEKTKNTSKKTRKKSCLC